MDRGIGQVLDLLDELKIADNTLVLFTSDNGPHYEGGHQPGFFDSNGPLKGHKRDLYEGGIRVPLITYWPGTVKAGAATTSARTGTLCRRFVNWQKSPRQAHRWHLVRPHPHRQKTKETQVPLLGISFIWQRAGHPDGRLESDPAEGEKRPRCANSTFQPQQDIGEKKNIAENTRMSSSGSHLTRAHTPSERFPLYAKKKQ